MTTSTARRPRVAFIHSGSSFHLADLADPAVRARDLVEIYAPDMTSQSLDEVSGVYLGARQHPGVLRGIVPFLLEFLDRPGVKVVVDGENRVSTWLPGTSETPRGTNFWAWRTGEDLGRHCVCEDHPMWDYLTPESVHWHYHAVLEPPDGASTLVRLDPVQDPLTGSSVMRPGTDPWGLAYGALDDHPNTLLYHDAVTFPAEIVVSTMDATYHHGAGFMPGATQLFYRLLEWLGTPREVSATDRPHRCGGHCPALSEAS
jgi:hypothetical protein